MIHTCKAFVNLTLLTNPHPATRHLEPARDLVPLLGMQIGLDPLLLRVHAAVQLQHRNVVAGGGTYGGVYMYI